MFQASNMTYMRRREAEKKATRRAMQKAELRRQKMEELQLQEAAQGNQEEEEGDGETQSEFYDVCNNIQKTESGDRKKKRKHHKVITASD